MKINTIFISFVLMFFSSCKEVSKQTQDQEVIIPIINLEEAIDNLTSKKMNFSEFADDITYVPLETNKNIILGGKRRPPIHVTEHYIFCGEDMFGRDGRFIKRFGKKGQGPGEYLMAIGVAVDEKREEFYVYDNYTHNIYIYDFSNNFKKEIKTGLPAGGGINYLGNGKMMAFRDTDFRNSNDFFEYKIIDLDSDSILYTRTHNKRIEDENCAFNKGWQYNNEHFYYEGLTDTIFSLAKNGKIDTARYLIKRGKYDCSNEEAYIRIGEIAESKSYLFFSIKHRTVLYYVSYNKSTGEMQASEFSRFFNNDIDGGFLWLFNNVGNGIEGYYSVLPFIAQERIENLSRENRAYDKEKNQKLKQLIDDLEEDANDVFYFFHFK